MIHVLYIMPIDPILLGILITIAVIFIWYVLLCAWIHFDIIYYYCTCKCCRRNYIEINNV